MEKQFTNEHAEASGATNKEAILVGLTRKLHKEKIWDILEGSPIPVPYKKFSGGRPGSEKEHWYGKPDIYRGLTRKIAHIERSKSETPYARMLYSDGGRRGDPWGACNLELNGHVYHFGAGLKRFPKLIDGKTAKPEAIGALAAGVPGFMECDATDWRWIQGEVDLTQLMPTEAINKLAALFGEYATNPDSVPTFQSKKHAETLGIPLNPSTHNCTTIVTDALQKMGGVEIPHCWPREAYKYAVEKVDSLPPDSHTSLDYALSALLCMDYIWLQRALKHAFKGAGIKPCNLEALTKSGAPIHSGFPPVDMTSLLNSATSWLGAWRH